MKILAQLLPLLALTSLFAQTEPDAISNSSAEPAGRERISLSRDWRFQKGDPAGNTTILSYDVRPEIKDARENQVADATPEEAEKLAAASKAVLKPWILPTGNAFIQDPARRHPRPEGNPGADVAYVQASFDDSAWRRIDLPHDWGVEGPFLTKGDFGGMGRLPSWGIAWYRKKFHLPSTDAGKTIVLEIDGAMSYATVWLNGHLVGGWPYGYSSWQLDLTPYVAFGGVNQIAIRLDNPPSSSRWYPGGGLYRDVWLTKTQPIHIGQWGTRVTTRDISKSSATVDLEVTVANDTKSTASVSLSSEIFALDAAGRKTGKPLATTKAAPLVINPLNTAKSQLSLSLANPALWGPPPTQTPNLYVAMTTVSRDGKTVDTYETRFGIRDIRFDPATGLHVNGERVLIRGVNNHHDLGALGAAFNLRAAERQLEMLRELGCNAIRMSHNPPAPEVLELTDRMGFLVMDEAFDCWERKKTPLDFHLIFPDWHEQDLRAMVRRDRNHPSIILWSIGNEVGEQYTDAAGAAIAMRLREIVREEDSTRLVTCAMNFAKPDMPLPATLDVISLNYQGEGIRQDPEFEGTTRIRTKPQYDAYRAKFPAKPILSSETASAFSTRGEYLFPVSAKSSDIVRDGRGGDSKNHFVTAYELHAVDFGSSAEKVFSSLDRHPFVVGEFVWTGWDHLGEPTPYYEARSSYSGIIDLAGFKKDRFYLYQSRWRPDLPMAHLLPHWTWPERIGQLTPVHVFTSGDEGELFLNGRSLGRKTKLKDQYRLRWDDVIYESGTLEVVTYKNGRRWATDTVKTAGTPVALDATPDRAEIAADGRDLSFVTIRITDAAGLTAPRAKNPLTFAIEGTGEIIATDNGDPTSFEPFQSPRRKAFNGLCLVIVRAKPNQSGTIKLTATADGLHPCTTTILARPR